jgi:hypothetical protein
VMIAHGCVAFDGCEVFYIPTKPDKMQLTDRFIKCSSPALKCTFILRLRH